MARHEGLSSKTAVAIYEILEETCGAPGSQRAHFVSYLMEDQPYAVEWRFMGALGFGGKFWRNRGHRPDGTWGETWYVNYYPESHTEERKTMQDQANERLWDLLQENERTTA